MPTARFCSALMGLLAVPVPVCADDTSAGPKTPDGRAISPIGRFSDDLTGSPARYYVWSDREGWHLRTCSRGNVFGKFTGTIKLNGGTFNRLRQIGLERTGRRRDKWSVSEDRRTITFEIWTTSSFDGFDFDVNGMDSKVEFDLKIGDRKRPGRVFIGSDGLHPTGAKFEFPAET